MDIKKYSEAFLHHCRFDKQLSAHTLSAYQQDLNQFLAFIKENQVDKNTIRNYLKFLSQTGYSSKTIKRRMACLKAMFKWLEFEDLITENPFHKIRINIKLPRQLPKNIPPTSLSKLLKTAQAINAHVINSAYNIQPTSRLTAPRRIINQLNTLVTVELLFSTGIRVGEMVGIQLHNIHFEESKIKILGKGQRERCVFMVDQAIKNLLQSYLHYRTLLCPQHNHLLINTRGQPASTHLIRKLLKQLAIQAQIPQQITPHMYRHSAACELLQSGIDMRYVQKLLGHQSISTTELYTHVNDQILKDKITHANTRKRII